MSGEIVACGGCGAHGLLKELLDLGEQPLAEGRSDNHYPLRLVRCANCRLVQLSYIVDPAEVFPEDHPYTTGNSAVLRRHYMRLTGDLEPRPGSVVVDIGANDGTLLDGYPEGLTRIAVEPTDQILKCVPDIERVQEPWAWTLAHKLHAKYGTAKVITACNVLAHVPDAHDFLEGVTELLADDGIFVTENHDLYSILDGLQVDTIYHEHLRYYSAASLTRLLEEHGLRVTHVRQVPVHGGSFRVYARKAKEDFPARVRQAAVKLHDLLEACVPAGHEIAGIGATTRAAPLIHFAKIDRYLSYVCEVAGSEKIGTEIPGTDIPVVDEKRLLEEQPPYALLLSWHLADYIVPELREAGYKGRFITPLPEPRVLDD